MVPAKKKQAGGGSVRQNGAPARVCFLHVRGVNPDCDERRAVANTHETASFGGEPRGRGIASSHAFGRLPLRSTTDYDDWTIDRWRLEPKLYGIRMPAAHETEETSPPLWKDVALASAVAILLWGGVVLVLG